MSISEEGHTIQYDDRTQGQKNLGDIIFMLSVNFLLYVVLIIVFYMLLRFYLEEETATRGNEYFTTDEVIVEEEELEDGYDGDISLLAHEIESSEKKQMLPSSKSSSRQTSPRLRGLKKDKSFLNFNDWGKVEGTKQEVIQRAAFCTLGLWFSFCVWGLVQERLLTKPYDGNFFEYSYGLVFLTRFGGFILSIVLMKGFGVTWVPTALWEYSFPSVANMLSSWCQYEALKYVSFPTVMLAKAFKMVPVMLMGKFMMDKTYESYEYVCGVMVAFGLYLFLSTAEDITFSENVFGQPENINGAMCGVVLLLLFLFTDSATGQWQARLFKLSPNMSPLQMMLLINAFSAMFSFVTLINQEELDKTFNFIFAHPVMILHLSIFILSSVVGQVFIFYTVKSFGPVVFSIIMSIRILFSTILSCFVYNHTISELGVLGIMIVFGSIGYRIKRKSDNEPLLVWDEPKPRQETGETVLKEWHEHVDM